MPVLSIKQAFSDGSRAENTDGPVFVLQAGEQALPSSGRLDAADALPSVALQMSVFEASKRFRTDSRDIHWALLVYDTASYERLTLAAHGAGDLEALAGHLSRQAVSYTFVCLPLKPGEPSKRVLVRYFPPVDAWIDLVKRHSRFVRQFFEPLDATIDATSVLDVSEEAIREAVRTTLASRASAEEASVLRDENLVYAPRRDTPLPVNPPAAVTWPSGLPTSPPMEGSAKRKSKLWFSSGTAVPASAAIAIPQPKERPRSPVKRPQSVPLEDRDGPVWSGTAAVKCWRCGAGNVPVESAVEPSHKARRSKSVPPSRSYLSESMTFIKQHMSQRWRDIQKVEQLERRNSELEHRNVELDKELRETVSSLQALNMNLFKQMQAEKTQLQQRLTDERSAVESARRQMSSSLAKTESELAATKLALGREVEIKRQVEAELNRLRAQLQSAEREKSQMRSMVALEQNANAAAQAQIASLNSQLRDLQMPRNAPPASSLFPNYPVGGRGYPFGF